MNRRPGQYTYFYLLIFGVQIIFKTIKFRYKIKFIFQHNEIVEDLTVRSQTGDSSLLLVIKHTLIL